MLQKRQPNCDCLGLLAQVRSRDVASFGPLWSVFGAFTCGKGLFPAALLHPAAEA